MSWQGWVVFVLLLILGVLAAAKFIVARAPNAGATFAKIAPFQGFVGIGALAFGLYLILDYLFSGGFAQLVYIASMLVLIILGALLGYALLKGQLGGKAAAQGEQLQAKLSKQQTTLGLVALGLAIALLIVSL